MFGDVAHGLLVGDGLAVIHQLMALHMALLERLGPW